MCVPACGLCVCAAWHATAAGACQAPTAARALLPPPACLHAAGSAAGGGSPLRARTLSSAPRLPNGSLPASAAAAAAASPAPALSTLRLLDDISKACLEAQLPGELLGDPEFAFLAPEGGRQ